MLSVPDSQAQVNPMDYLGFLTGKKWIIKDKVQQSSKNMNAGEVVFTWALDKRIIKFTRYYYLSTNNLRPGAEGTFALNPFSEKIRRFTFSDDGQTTEGLITQINQQKITLEYSKFTPDGQQIKTREIYQKQSENKLEVRHFSWDGNNWQAKNTYVWIRGQKQVAYTPPTKKVADNPQTFTSEQWDVPVIFAANSKSKGLDFKTYSSEVDVYPHSYSYEVVGSIKINKLIVSKLDLKIELLDKDGKVRFTETDMTINKFMTSSYRSGDEVPFKIIKSIKNQPLVRIAKARLKVQNIGKIPAPEKFAPSKNLKLLWSKNKPANVGLEIRERLSNVTNSYKKDFYRQKLILEVKNTGHLVLKTIIIKVEWLNPQNQVVFSKKGYVSTIINPDVLPGKTRLYKGSFSLPRNKVTSPNRYRIIIDSVTL